MQYQHEKLTQEIIGAAIEVHKVLGPGLLESVYKKCLCWELEILGLNYKQELSIPFTYKNNPIDYEFRIDLLVEDRIVIELKSVEQILPVHEAQLLTYLKLTNK